MPATFDLTAARQFVASLEKRRAECNDEGMFCSDLDEKLGCRVAVCKDLLFAVRRWGFAVYSVEINFDAEVEALFKGELKRVLDDSASAVEQARPLDSECFELERLDELEWYVSQIETMLGNWVTPQRSIAPAPRTVPGDDADRQIRERLESLTPLPADWRPTDAWQARRFDGRSAD